MSRGDDKVASSYENRMEDPCSTEDKTEIEARSKEFGTETNFTLASEAGSGPAVLSSQIEFNQTSRVDGR